MIVALGQHQVQTLGWPDSHCPPEPRATVPRGPATLLKSAAASRRDARLTREPSGMFQPQPSSPQQHPRERHPWGRPGPLSWRGHEPSLPRPAQTAARRASQQRVCRALSFGVVVRWRDTPRASAIPRIAQKFGWGIQRNCDFIPLWPPTTAVDSRPLPPHRSVASAPGPASTAPGCWGVSSSKGESREGP